MWNSLLDPSNCDEDMMQWKDSTATSMGSQKSTRMGYRERQTNRTSPHRYLSLNYAGHARVVSLFQVTLKKQDSLSMEFRILLQDIPIASSGSKFRSQYQLKYLHKNGKNG